MTNPPPREKVHTYEKSAKDKVRKSGTSAESWSSCSKTHVTRDQTDRQLRQPSRATVRSEGDMWTGSSEVGAAAEERAHANTVVSQSHNNNVSINSAGRAGEAAISHSGTPHAARHGDRRAEDWSQVNQRMADDSALRNAGRCVVKQEMPDNAVADGTRRAAPSASMLGFRVGGVSERVEAGYKVEDERFGDVSK
ncbi:hypothetical protein CKAH01_19045 [Colletotrichum kahawae]|uniref:Uncharacterized protein n=1 Tax=Colletotrichum kahawae TaxID=34407 RepID=A0AAE0D1F1_COLKA|nr:hypothetical protein CKAH01_19045 [Colletotrichum kahawae]